MIPFIIAGAAMGAGFVIGSTLAKASGPFVKSQYDTFVKGCDDFASGFEMKVDDVDADPDEDTGLKKTPPAPKPPKTRSVKGKTTLMEDDEKAKE